mgnify:CR=1 FL=1
MKKAVFEGRIFRDVSNYRNPVKMILDEKKNPIKLFEQLLSDSGVVPKVATTHVMSKRYPPSNVDHVLNGDGFVVTRDSVLANLKKVRVTVIVEEI